MKIFKLFFITLIVIALSANFIFAQNNEGNEKYSQVRIFATKNIDFQKLANADLHLDGGTHKPGLYFETWLSESEIELLKKSGVSYQITIPDWMEYYNNLPKMSPFEIQQALEQSIRDYNVTHSIYGTMGGHLKWEEAIAKLDSLRLEYPLYVSQKFSIGNSYENRALWTVRITKNPDAPTGRPEIWYNALTHAREPVGMSNIFYFIYWLLENNNIDPIATYILNNREIYFTIAINPDGYVYNQTTNPNGGGNWRKNRKPQGSYIGVDLNRNFGTYNFWNSTNNGSSTSPSSDTYRGPAPFSEPETQVFRDFLNARNFRAGLDYHTYGNLLIKPWAWCDPVPTAHDYIYNEYGADITAENGFLFGTPYQTVNYYVRGGDLDWCYSTDSTGHTRHVFTMTPEVGSSFWPTQAQILPLVQSCLYMNKYYALIAGPYTGLKSATFNKNVYTQGETGNVKIVFKNKGLYDAQNVKVELAPVSNYLTIPVQIYTKASLPVFVSDSNTFNFSIASNCPNNTALNARLRIKQNDSVIVHEELLSIFVGTGYTILADSAENGTGNWPTMTSWAIVTNKYLSPTHSFKGSCVSNQTTQMISVPVNVSSYPAVYLSFYSKHALETGYDYGYIDVSSDNGVNWQQLSSYNGIDSSVWKFRTFNITNIVGGSTNMKVRFRIASDASLNWDGWYVDNIKLTGYQTSPLTGVIGNNSIIPSVYSLEQNYPNPFNPVTQIKYSLPKEGLVKITVFDVLGRVVKNLINEVKPAGYYSVEFNGSELPSGIYLYRMESGYFTDTRKLTLVK
jgi:hypothetical protein